MSDLDLLSFYLGIDVRQSQNVVMLGQAAYTGKLLEKVALPGCNPLLDTDGCVAKAVNQEHHIGGGWDDVSQPGR